jgi:hypothetical protein
MRTERKTRTRLALLSGINTFAQLRKINECANELLDQAMGWNRGDDVELQLLEGQVRKVRVGKGKDAHWITEYKFKDPRREIGLRAMQETRERLKLQMEMYKTLYDFQANAEFQQELIDLLGEIDPNVRDEFVCRFERNSFLVRPAVGGPKLRSVEVFRL